LGLCRSYFQGKYVVLHSQSKQESLFVLSYEYLEENASELSFKIDATQLNKILDKVDKGKGIMFRSFFILFSAKLKPTTITAQIVLPLPESLPLI